MPERKDDYKRSLFLSAVGTLLLTVVAAVIKRLAQPGEAAVMHSFLPLAMGSYMVAFGVGLVAGRQTIISRNGGPWTPALVTSWIWSAATSCLGFFGMLAALYAFMMGL